MTNRTSGVFEDYEAKSGSEELRGHPAGSNQL
jgi:hypothetical protein